VEEGAHARSFRTPVPFIPLLNPPLEPLPPSPFPLHRGFTPRSAHSRARVAITASGSPCNGLLIGSKVTVTKGYREYYRPAMTRAMTRLDRHVRPLRPAPPPPSARSSPPVSRFTGRTSCRLAVCLATCRAAGTPIARANIRIYLPFRTHSSSSLPPSSSPLPASCWLADRARTYARTRFTTGFRVLSRPTETFKGTRARP